MHLVLRIILVWLLGVGLLHIGSSVWAVALAEGESRLTNTGVYRVYFYPPPVVAINRYQVWGIYIEDAAGNALNGIKLEVDADMPAHGHGLLTQPKVKPGNAPGRYRVEGLRFHMPGYWEIRLHVNDRGNRDGLIFPVELE
jgi:hypothetical protein